MQRFILLLLLCFAYTSCRSGKINRGTESKTKKDTQHHLGKRMIHSGDSIELKTGKSEILFYGEDPTPKKVLFKNDSLARIQRKDSL